MKDFKRIFTVPGFRDISGTMIWIVPVCLVLLLISGYYAIRWDTPGKFVTSFDHNSVLFHDFIGHYYPMGKTILGTSQPVPGFFYSAFAALLFAPLGRLDPTDAIYSWGVIQFAGLMGLLIIPLLRFVRLSPVWAGFYTLLLAISFPIIHNTVWGQLSVLITLGVIAVFQAHANNRRILAGVLLALLASIKYYPGVFIVYFFFKRDYRVCTAFVLSAILFYVLLPVLVMGPHSWLSFETVRSASLANSSWISEDVNSQYFKHVVARWWQFLQKDTSPIAPKAAVMLTLLGYAVFLHNLAAIWVIRQSKKGGQQYVFPMMLIFLSLPFVIKTSWPHYFSYLPFCQIAVLFYVKEAPDISPTWKGAILLLALLSIACSSIFAFEVFGHWYIYNAFGMVFTANLLLLIAVNLFIYSEVAMKHKLHLGLPNVSGG